MTEQERKSQSNKTVVVPKEYVGQWIVWDRQRTKILGSGENLKELKATALATGEDEPAYEWVLPSNRRIVGLVKVKQEFFDWH